MANFLRQFGSKKYRKIFVIATEGKETEQEYFSILKKYSSATINLCHSNTNSNPFYVLKRLKQTIKYKNLKENDEAWVVIDKDSWTTNDIEKVYKWATKSDNYGVALSNPCFEYWLLLHFDDGNDLSTKEDCKRRLKIYMPNYDKHIDATKITKENIEKAIQRCAIRLQNASKKCIPYSFGSSTVNLLVYSILIEQDS